DVAPARPAWVAEACDSPTPANRQPRHNLLTLAGRRVVFCSNTGAVAAFDARTGQRAWGVQYPRTNRSAVSVDPAAAVAFGGRVFAAPSDAARAYAFDAETGEELWQSGPIEGGQIVGVARNRIVITSTGPVRGIRGLDSVTGSYRDAGGWIRANGMLGYGQGLANDNAILWPTRDGLYFLDPESGDPIRTAPPLRTLSHGPEHFFGHLAFAAGWLVAVTPNEIRAYHTEAPPFARPPGTDPRDAFQTLADQAERDLASGNEAAARATLTEAARGNLPRQYRAWAAARLVRLDFKEPPSPAVQSLLTPELLGEWLLTEKGEFTTLEGLRARRAGSAARSPPRPVSTRKPVEPPSPGASLGIAAEQQLPPGSRPLLSIPGTEPPSRLFVATPSDLLSVGTIPGAIVRHAPGHFTHAGELADGILAAGPLEIAIYAKDREPLWRFRVPGTPSLPGPDPHAVIHTGDPPTPPEMSSFAVARGRLFARLGERHLIAFDLAAGRVAWLLGTHGRRRFESNLFPTAPHFTPHYYCSERLLIAQLSDGRRWMVQASSGRVWNDNGATFRDAVPDGFGARTALAPWPSPPVADDGDAVAIADGPDRIAFASLGDRPKRRFPIHGESSLTGEPPQLRRWSDDVFIAVRRNYGVEVQRIDSTTARAVWSGATFLETSRLDLAAADADPQRIFLTTGKKLIAVNRDDGSIAWDASLPLDGSWQVRAGRRNLLVYPTEAIAEEPVEAAFDRLQRSFLRNPQPWRLPWLAAAFADSWQERTLPVLVFDSESGRRLAVLQLAARGPGAVIRWEADRGAAFAGERIVWLK
ncbi:MAG TPA: PQQ-binding-like beta-propeller repeat protein, partial [Gemmataceae bacterium]